MTTSRLVGAVVSVAALGSVVTAHAGPPKVLSAFGALTGPEGFGRPAPHDGVDLAAPVGTPVLAPADGTAHRVFEDRLCGRGLIIVHGRYATVYCHLSEQLVRQGQAVTRGERIGVTGITGQRPDAGFEHLHFEVREGWRYEDPHLDPMPFVVGCYEAGRTYAADRFALTYPLPC